MSNGNVQPPVQQERSMPCGIAPVTLEFGDSWNRNIILDTLYETVLRGRFSLAGLHARTEEKNGKMVKIGGVTVSPELSVMPEVPGMRMTIDAKESTARIFDPLEDDPELLDDINRVQSNITSLGGKITFVKSVVRRLDEPTLKTLLREMCRLVEAKSATVVEGSLPKLKQIEKLPGRFLYDPAFKSQIKPRYEGDPIPYAGGVPAGAT